jgi:hypothetical protein
MTNPNETKVVNIPAGGNAVVGDYFVGEHTPGTTVTLTYAPKLSMDPAPMAVGQLNMAGQSITGLTNIYDVNGNLIIALSATAAAVNYITCQNAATGTTPGIVAAGANTNINLNLTTKGAGTVNAASTGTTPFAIYSGTAYQNITNFTTTNTAGTFNLALPAASGTVALTDVPHSGTGSASFTANAPICGGTTTTGALQSSTNGSNGQIYQSAGSSTPPGWTTATYPTAAGTSSTFLKSNGTNIVNTTSTWPDTGTSGKMIIGTGSNTYAESTPTWANTYAASTILYSNGANNVQGLATANSSILATNGSGVPAMTTTIPFTVPVSTGGTGLTTTTTPYGIVCAGTTTSGALQVLNSLGSSGQILMSNGASALPSWSSAGASTGRLLSFQIFTSGTAATYTKNVSATSILVEAVGGGGGSGGAIGAVSSVSASGGGGSGAYCQSYITSAASTYTYTIGAAGSAGASGSNAGGNGGNTTFSGGSISAGGGTGGGAGISTGTAGAAFVLGGAGGTASGGNQINAPGQPGSPGLTILTSFVGGNGGASKYGSGGLGSNAGTGGAGTGYGGGAGGSIATTTNFAGAAGTAGLLIIWEFA